MADLILPYPSWGGELAGRTAHFTKQISFLIPGKVPFLSQNAWRELIILLILFTPLAKIVKDVMTRVCQQCKEQFVIFANLTQ